MKTSLLLDFNDAVQHPGRKESYEVETSLEDEADLDLVQPITATIEGVSTGNQLLLTGSGQTRAVVECARCLKPVEVKVELQVEEVFAVVGTPSGYHSGGFAEVVEEDENKLFEGNSLRFEELLRQSVWVNLPTRVLCSESCPGLEEAGSHQDEHHNPFSQLSDFAKKKGNK